LVEGAILPVPQTLFHNLSVVSCDAERCMVTGGTRDFSARFYFLSIPFQDELPDPEKIVAELIGIPEIRVSASLTASVPREIQEPEMLRGMTITAERRIVGNRLLTFVLMGRHNSFYDVSSEFWRMVEDYHTTGRTTREPEEISGPMLVGSVALLMANVILISIGVRQYALTREVEHKGSVL
jgi:hypothetical protein